MSTRCNVKIVTVDNEGHNKQDYPIIWLYHHCDGYPEGVGRELLAMLPKGKYLGYGANVANRLMKMPEPMYDLAYSRFEITSGMHGDIEYLYEVFVGKNNGIEVKAYERRVIPTSKTNGKYLEFFEKINLEEYRGGWESEEQK